MKDNTSDIPSKARPQFLMCPPDYYRICEPSEQYGHFNDQSVLGFELYQKDPNEFKKKALLQWQQLHDCLSQNLNVEIHLLAPQPNLYDQVFTADASVSIRDNSQHTSVLSQFTHPLRQQEVAWHRELLTQLNKGVLTEQRFASEGAGDNVYDSFRDFYWSGYNLDLLHPANGRSDRASHDVLHQATGIQVISLEVQRPFFHIDTCLAPLSRGHMMLYRGGMTDSAYETVIREGFYEFGLEPDQYLIEVTEQEAHGYACNLIQIENAIIMPPSGDRLSKKLKGLGYQVFEVDVSYFLSAGGGPHCLINYVNQPRNLHPRNARN